MNPNETTRRALVAGLALAPMAGVPALAGATPMSDALAQAIGRHKAAMAAWSATEGDEADEIANALGDEERDAKWELATLPCDSVADLLAKLQYLLELERRTWAGWSEPASQCHEPFGCVVVAIDAHLNPDNYYEEA